MELNDFINDFAVLFDDTDSSEITASTKFHELNEWSSLLGLGLIAMAKTQYGKTITGAEIRDCVTVEDVFLLVSKK